MEDLTKELGGKAFKKVCLRESELNKKQCKYILSIDIKQQITEAIQQKYQWGILIASVQTDTMATAIARVNSQQSEKLQLFQESDLNNYANGVTLAGPCVNKQYQEKTRKKWELKENITATTATSYDATMVLIEAIKKSSDKPTREEVLKHLKSLQLGKDKTSGFGLKWSTNPKAHFNIKRKY
ncbi:MAG: hypothetical protein ACKO2V_13530, partial [Snowella sp.]